ncbi:MAG: helix-turn-helix domain-containing protein [Lachnospiraceae bacterium]|nr:helix-turn-helix domain-containing protein [Lachnospiraceae bacterium]
MDAQREITELRNATGMNRRQFSDYYGIPYRTVQDWEAGKRTMPEYVIELMKYKAEQEGILPQGLTA